jgi:hypothetical protein
MEPTLSASVMERMRSVRIGSMSMVAAGVSSAAASIIACVPWGDRAAPVRLAPGTVACMVNSCARGTNARQRKPRAMCRKPARRHARPVSTGHAFAESGRRVTGNDCRYSDAPMKIGMITDSLADVSFDVLVDTAARLELDMLEFGCGNWSRAPHLALDRMLESADARRDFERGSPTTASPSARSTARATRCIRASTASVTTR